MTGLLLFSFTIFVYCCLMICKKLIKDSKQHEKVSKLIILITSYLFAAYADWRFSLVLALLSFTTYHFAKKKKHYRIGVTIVLFALGYFKYTNFFISSFTKLVGKNADLLDIILPWGISFYTFSRRVLELKRCRIRA